MIDSIVNLTPCFVVGRGRSGTTLFTSILNTNDNISVAPESLFIMNLYNKYGSRTFDVKLIQSFYNDLWLEDRLGNWNLDRASLLDWLMEYGVGKRFPEVCKIVYARYACEQGKEGALWLGDKNPHHSLFINDLIHMFPNSKFLYLFRDYRDNVVSYQNVPFDSNNPTVLAYRWKKYNEMIQDAIVQHPTRFLNIKYEDLVTDSHPVLQSACQFLDIPFDEQMLEHHKHQSGSKGDWHSNISSPLSTKSMNRWSSELSKFDLAKVESICADFGSRLGYLPAVKHKINHQIFLFPSVIYASILIKLEIALFSFPLWLRTKILHSYRKSTGTI